MHTTITVYSHTGITEKGESHRQILLKALASERAVHSVPFGSEAMERLLFSEHAV